MNIRNYFTLASALLCLLFAGCKDELLNTKPLDLVSDAAVFQDLAFARAFLNETYEGVPSGFDRGFYLLDAATDIAEMGYPWPYSQNWNQGDFSPTNVPKFAAPWDNAPTAWNRYYNRIRRANDIINKIDQVQVNTAAEIEEKKGIKGEAYFLRALFYHELVKLYGGVPLISRAQSFEDVEGQFVPRSTFEESVNYIVANLDSAAALLPNKRSGRDVGRASRAAALALKGRQFLYAERWAESAEASALVMAMSEYSLFPNYEELFWAVNNNNSEILFARQFLTRAENRTHPGNQFNSVPKLGGWGGTQPTQNIVDEYEMVDGLDYKTSPLYNPAKPYDNRDPRFEASILHDQSNWYQFADGKFVPESLELYDGAFQGVNGSSNDATKTGYFLRKFMDPAIISVDNNNGYNNWNILRLAEVMLNYAEARNEAVGPDASVYDAVNAIRSRPSVQMPPLPAGLSKEQMRERIRHERTIELAFEEHRFFDLRRWKDSSGQYLANTVLNQPIYGMRINPARTTYTRFKKEDRVYEPKHRLLPVEQNEIAKYPTGTNMQTPGW